MPVTIAIPTALRQFAGGQSEINVDARTAGEALERLTTTHVELRRHLFNDQNAMRNFVNVYVNDEDIRHQDGPNTPVKDGDTILIVPSIAGGSAVIEDLHSTNHTFVGRLRVTAPHTLADGDVIRFGGPTAVFRRADTATVHVKPRGRSSA